jgi:hypothetical protein
MYANSWAVKRNLPQHVDAGHDNATRRAGEVVPHVGRNQHLADGLAEVPLRQVQLVRIRLSERGPAVKAASFSLLYFGVLVSFRLALV